MLGKRELFFINTITINLVRKNIFFRINEKVICHAIEKLIISRLKTKAVVNHNRYVFCPWRLVTIMSSVVPSWSYWTSSQVHFDRHIYVALKAADPVRNLRGIHMLIQKVNIARPCLLSVRQTWSTKCLWFDRTKSHCTPWLCLQGRRCLFRQGIQRFVRGRSWRRNGLPRSRSTNVSTKRDCWSSKPWNRVQEIQKRMI